MTQDEAFKIVTNELPIYAEECRKNFAKKLFEAANFNNISLTEAWKILRFAYI